MSEVIAQSIDEPLRSDYNLAVVSQADKDDRICTICGNTGARNVYNGIICSACRVFFYRCVTKHLPLPCSKGNNCEMTIKSRGNCAACRYRFCQQKLDLKKVGQSKRYPTKVITIQPGAIAYFLKEYHSALLTKSPMIQPGSVDHILACHRLSLNDLGPSPSTATINPNISLAQLLVNPTLCTSRTTVGNYLSEFQAVQFSLPRTYCRWLVSYIDFLHSTQYFLQFPKKEQELLTMYNFADFRLLCLVECKLTKPTTQEKWVSFSQRFSKATEVNALCANFARGLNCLMVETIGPLFQEINFDVIEFTIIKIIAMFSTSVEMSEEGVKRAFMVKEAYTMKLADYIANTYPEMSRPDQLLRLRRLLEMIRQIKEVSRSLTLGFSKLSLSEDLARQIERYRQYVESTEASFN